MHILISGAGIAGPTLAWFLAKTGAKVSIVERARSLLSHGQNIDIDGGAITAVKKMGLFDEIRKRNTTEKGTEFIGPDGKPFAPFPQDGNSVSLTSDLEILRGDLAIVFYEATKNLSNVEYIFGTTVEKVISNSEDDVKVELSDGRVQNYDLLVAADGQWSKVRQQCFAPETVTTVDKNMAAAYWTLPRLPSDNDMWNIYQALESRIITIRPDPYGTMRACVTRMYCNDRQRTEWLNAARSDKKTQQELLRREFSDAGWQTQRLLDTMKQAPDFYFQAVQQIRMSKWFKSRVVCLGDAAYAPTPLTGAGASLAIMGAYVLAGELSKLKENEHPARALEAYDRTFRPHVEKIQYLPWFIPGIAHPDTEWKRTLFRIFISTLCIVVKSPWFKLFGGPGEDNNNGFLLPQYPTMEEKICRWNETAKSEVEA